MPLYLQEQDSGSVSCGREHQPLYCSVLQVGTMWCPELPPEICIQTLSLSEIHFLFLVQLNWKKNIVCNFLRTNKHTT